MAEAKLVKELRPHTGAPAVTEKSRTSPVGQKQGKVVPVEVPKLTDLPGYMDALGWPISAKLMRRWFAADAYEMKMEEKIGEVPPSQYAGGKRPDLIDTTTVRMSWVLGFNRAKTAYDALIKKKGVFGLGKYGFDTVKARAALVKKITKAKLFSDTEKVFGDTAKPTPWQHEHWQFQREIVDGDRIDKFERRLLGLDDLYGGLGVFSINVAAFGTVIPKNQLVGTDEKRAVHTLYHTVNVSYLAVYARDTYDFLKDQYLGHWNKHGVEVIDVYALPDMVPGLPPIPPKLLQPSGEPPDMKLAVGNWNFQEYRRRHNKGGDQLTFSDVIVVELDPPWSFKVINGVAEE